MLFILLVSLLLLLPHFIRLLFFLFCCIFGALYFRVFAFRPLLFWSFMHILTLIGASDLKDCKSTIRFCIFFFWRFSYFLEEQEIDYHFFIFHKSWILCYDIYHLWDSLIISVTYWYEYFSSLSHSYLLWQQEYCSNCTQLCLL